MARIIWDNTYANADSSVFEVISKGTIIRAYGLGNVKATLYSLYGPQGAFLTVPYSQDLLSVLDADHNEVVVNSSGRFKLVLDDYGVAATNGVILTTDIQDVTATADVPQPSGAQANRPNVLVDTFKIPSLNTSPVIEITDEAWLFVAYGNELNVCQVVTVVGEGANEVEAPFIVISHQAIRHYFRRKRVNYRQSFYRNDRRNRRRSSYKRWRYRWWQRYNACG
jgi:hypothetical protein